MLVILAILDPHEQMHLQFVDKVPNYNTTLLNVQK